MTRPSQSSQVEAVLLQQPNLQNTFLPVKHCFFQISYLCPPPPLRQHHSVKSRFPQIPRPQDSLPFPLIILVNQSFTQGSPWFHISWPWHRQALLPPQFSFSVVWPQPDTRLDPEPVSFTSKIFTSEILSSGHNPFQLAHLVTQIIFNFFFCGY